MKKHALLVALLFSLIPFSLLACDECGSAAPSYQYGLQRFLHGHKLAVGWRYAYQHYESRIPLGLSGSHSQQLGGFTFQETSLNAVWQPIRLLELEASIPYVWHRYERGGVVTDVKGVGDMRLMARLVILQRDAKRKTARKETSVRQKLSIGIGMKAPTGSWVYAGQDAETANLNYQPGSGSWDLFLDANYSYAYGPWEVQGNIQYRNFLPNERNCQFGDQVQGAALVAYTVPFKKIKIIPTAGFSAEQTYRDNHYNRSVKYSGGQALLSQAGVYIHWNNFSLGGIWQYPLYENYTQRHLYAANRFSIALQWQGL